MMRSPRANHYCHLSALLIAVALLALLAPGGHAAPPAALSSFIPLDSPGAASIDVPWLWQSAAPFRQIPEIGKGVQAAQEAMGLSFEQDLLPWVGQMAVIITGVAPDGSGCAICLQIRDGDHMLESARVEAILRKMLPGGDKAIWTAMDYKGVAIWRTEIPQGRSVLKVATATLDGWFVIAIGDGVIRKVIDTRKGDNPSLAQHPSFARAMDSLPADGVGMVYVNGQGILAQVQKGDADAALRLKDSELGKFFVAGVITAPENDLRFDAVYCTTAANTRAVLKQLNADAGRVTGAALTQLPGDAFATLLLPNPDKWVEAVKQLMLNAAPDDDARQALQQGMAEMDGVRAVLRQFTGELGAGAVWRENQGFGVTVAGQTDTPADATTAAAAIGAFLKLQHLPVAEKDGLYTIPATQNDAPTFPMLLCWRARRQWLVGASHPDWLAKPGDQPALVLPDSAKNASLVAFGDFSFLPTMMKSMHVGDDVLAMLSANKLMLGKWAIALKIDEDGGAVRCHITGGGLVFATAAAVLFPVFAKAREKARATTSISNLRQLAIALQMYAQDNNDKLPVMKTTADMKKYLTAYLGSDQQFVSPRTGEAYLPNPGISGKALGAIDHPDTMIAFYENTPGPDGTRAVAFLDGHVELVPADRWAEVKRQAKMP